jgi:homoserine kinase
LEKGLPLASGLGSSAASAVAAAVAVDRLLGLALPRETLLAAAVEGERAGVGSAHADNAAASLYGGFVLVRRVAESFHVLELPVPEGFSCAVVHPHVEVDTGKARQLLGDRVALPAAVTQWGNTAAFVAGLYRGDADLLRGALVDVVAEPLRAAQVPGFEEMKRAAIATGALGCSLSGSGPSTFALTLHLVGAEIAGEAMAEALFGAVGGCDVFVSSVAAPGARVLEAGEEAMPARQPAVLAGC